jgi:Bacterial transcriptional activator domain
MDSIHAPRVTTVRPEAFRDSSKGLSVIARRRRSALLTLLTCGALAVSAAAVPVAAAAPSPGDRTAVAAPSAGELPDRRTATSATRRNADGSLTTTRFAAPVHYQSGGHRLRVLPGKLDLEQFNRLADRGERLVREGQLPEAVNCLERALGMWRGPALDGVACGPVLEAKVTLLEERRLVVTERWAQLRTELGTPEQVAMHLRALAVEYPLRERLWGS